MSSMAWISPRVTPDHATKSGARHAVEPEPRTASRDRLTVLSAAKERTHRNPRLWGTRNLRGSPRDWLLPPVSRDPARGRRVVDASGARQGEPRVAAICPFFVNQGGGPRASTTQNARSRTRKLLTKQNLRFWSTALRGDNDLRPFGARSQWSPLRP